MVVSAVFSFFLFCFISKLKIWYILLVITITNRNCSHILSDLSYTAPDEHRSPLGHIQNNWFLPVMFTLQRSLEVWCNQLSQCTGRVCMSLYSSTTHHMVGSVPLCTSNTLRHFFIKGTVSSHCPLPPAHCHWNRELPTH